MKEVDLANQYLNMCGKSILDIIKILKTFVIQGAKAFDDKNQRRLLAVLNFYDKFIREGQGNEIFFVNNLTKHDVDIIKDYMNNILGDKDRDNVEEFSMPAMFCPCFNTDDNVSNCNYFMLLRQKDVHKLSNMLIYFEDNGIKLDNLSLKDYSVVNDPNSLFSEENKDVKKGEIEIPISQKDIFENVKNFMLTRGYEFSIAPHDTSISIIYKHDDQKRLLNEFYDDKNSFELFNTTDKEKVAAGKKLLILDGDKTLNDRDAQVSKLFENEGR